MAKKKLKKKKTLPTLRDDIEGLLAELAEAKETLRAIQSGEVDALVVNDDEGDRIFTLKSADQPYRIMVENMNEGAATLRKDGVVFYCNHRFAELLKSPLESVIGGSIYDYVPAAGLENLKALISLESEKGGNSGLHTKS